MKEAVINKTPIDREKLSQELEDMLRPFGLCYRYSGYPGFIDAILLAVENPQRLSCVSKEIYAPVAAKYGLNPINVERNIRTMVDACWYDGDRELIQRICHRKHKPSNGAFLAGLYSHLARQLHLMDKPACRAAAAAEKSGKGSGDF